MKPLPTTVYSAAQTAELDRRVIASGIAGFELMQRAADAAFSTLLEHWPRPGCITVLCGPGNNGGDGFLIARLARRAGIATHLLLLGKRDKVSGDAARALSAYEQDGGEIEPWQGQLPAATEVIVDALLGTGLGRPVEGRFEEAVRAINAAADAGAGVLAVDIPSGLDADRGSVWGVAVRADATATFIGCKLGLLTGAGPAHVGVLTFADLGAPAKVCHDAAYLARRVDARDLALALPPRARDAHKGRHGHVLCVGGDHGMGGAVRMAAEAALRVGAGLVSVATRPTHVAAMTQARPELMCHGVDCGDGLGSLLQRAKTAAIGPGLGQGQWGRGLFQQMLQARLPLVVDADALNLLAAEPAARGDWVLTPHPGEAGRLLGCSTGEVQVDRPAAATELARRYDAVVILKGAGSLVAAVDRDLWVCAEGNPGMAVGGMGDLLTGVVTGLLAQGLSAERAARVAVYLHAAAADIAAADGERGLLPGDCLWPLRRLVNPQPC